MCIKVLVLFMSVRGIAPNLVVNSYGEVPWMAEVHYHGLIWRI
jgi:hypothetical protein